MSTLIEKIHGLLVAVDDAAAALVFDGQTDLTISSRCGMALIDGRLGVFDPKGPHGLEQSMLKALGNGLNEIEQQHCFAAILSDDARAAAVRTLLEKYVTIVTAASLG